jgi:hypothetical protein
LSASDRGHRPAAPEHELPGYLDEWRTMLRHPARQARQMLRKLIDGRIVFTPLDGEVEVKLRCTLERLVTSVLLPKAVVAQPVFEWRWPGGRSAARSCLWRQRRQELGERRAGG